MHLIWHLRRRECCGFIEFTFCVLIFSAPWGFGNFTGVYTFTAVFLGFLEFYLYFTFDEFIFHLHAFYAMAVSP